MIFNKKCITCKKDIFRQSKSEASRNNWKYCSISCSTIAKNKKRKLPILYNICKCCNKDFPVRTKRERNYKFCSRSCSAIFSNKSIEKRNKISRKFSGKNSKNYIDGSSIKNKFRHKGFKYKIWRESVYKRDNWTCQNCKKIGGKLNADHIKPWSKYPELRYDIDNGKTLCISCHKKTNTWGAKSRRFIKNQYMKEPIILDS